MITYATAAISMFATLVAGFFGGFMFERKAVTERMSDKLEEIRQDIRQERAKLRIRAGHVEKRADKLADAAERLIEEPANGVGGDPSDLEDGS